MQNMQERRFQWSLHFWVPFTTRGVGWEAGAFTEAPTKRQALQDRTRWNGPPHSIGSSQSTLLEVTENSAGQVRMELGGARQVGWGAGSGGGTGKAERDPSVVSLVLT